MITANFSGVRIFKNFTLETSDCSHCFFLPCSHTRLTMYYIRPFLYDINKVSLRFSLFFFTQCIGYSTNCIGAVTNSIQMDTNTDRTVTKTLHKVTLTNS